MKQNLHIYFFVCVLFCFSKLSTAQTTTWDFTANNPSWPSAGMGSSPIEIVDPKGLGLHGIASNANFAAWNTTSSSTWSSPADAYSGTVRVQTNGGGFATGANESLPTQRYFFIQVNGACTVKVWFKSGSTGVARSVIASDGTANYGKATSVSTGTGLPTDGGFLNASVTKAGTFYLYSDASVNIYQIQVVGATVSTTPANPLPVTFENIAASSVNGSVNVSWSIATEVNTDKYVVEKSTDSRIFSAIGTVTATNAGKYSFADLTVNNGTNFYRIKALDKDGTFQYSTVVSVNNSNATASVQVYPNPIINGNLNVQLSNLNKGNYSISVYNAIGQILYNKNIIFNNLNTVLSIALPTSVKAGTYNLKITDGATSFTKTISIQ